MQNKPSLASLSALAFETLPVLKEWTIQPIFEQSVRICQTTLSIMVFLSKFFVSGAVKVQRNNKMLAYYHYSQESFKRELRSSKKIRQAFRLMENIVMAQIEWVVIWMHSRHSLLLVFLFGFFLCRCQKSSGDIMTAFYLYMGSRNARTVFCPGCGGSSCRHIR